MTVYEKKGNMSKRILNTSNINNKYPNSNEWIMNHQMTSFFHKTHK